jgi:hypothetical protein
MAKKATETKTRGLVAQAPEVLDPVTSEEVNLTTQVGAAINGFVLHALDFFKGAKAIEVTALATHAEMLLLQTPTTAAEDEALQLKIKGANRGKTDAEEYWKAITSVVFQFHRRLTGRRDRAVKAYEAASTHGNVLHNRYTAEAKRKADLENDRLRVEAEKVAAADRQKELDKLEADALKLEAASTDLSEREQTFVTSVLDGYPPIKAATRAGFTKPDAASARLMDSKKIEKAIDAGRAARAIRQQATAVKEMPLDLGNVETVQPDIVRAAGASDRTRYSAEFTDEAAFIDAVFAGRHGIPRDVLEINKTKVNQYARDMEELISKWPGCRAVKTTRVI